jgi:PAS domain S-box-containing protein
VTERQPPSSKPPRDPAHREQQELFHLLLNRVKDYAIFLVDLQGRVASWNAGAELVKGYQAEEIIGQPVSRFYTEEDRQAGVPAQLLETARTEGRVEVEAWRVRKDGTHFWADVVITALLDDTGILRGYAKVTRDLTERKRAEDDLHSSEERFRALAETANAAIVSADSSGRITYVNKGAERIFGYSAAEMVGSALTQIMPRRFHDSHLQGIKRFLSSGEAHVIGKTVELAGVRKDGTEFPVDLSLATWKSRGQTYFTGMIRDMTERKLAEARLREAHEDLASRNKDLARSNADLEQFAYVASHDLQEPVRMIITHVQLLTQEYGDKLKGEAEEYISFMLQGARRMQSLIKGLLAYSRVVQTEQAFREVNCETVLQHAMHNLNLTIVESGATITHDPLPTVKGDESQLMQLFQNLIGNGIKFRGKNPPKIHIGLSRGTAGWLLQFQDNGIGIDKRYVEQIFMPFRRLHTITQYPGSGIGLAICKKVAEHHGGHVWVESVVGEGSTFFVTIPESPANQEKGHTPS